MKRSVGWRRWGRLGRRGAAIFNPFYSLGSSKRLRKRQKRKEGEGDEGGITPEEVLTAALHRRRAAEGDAEVLRPLSGVVPGVIAFPPPNF